MALYTDIVEVVAPSEAQEGQVVNITVKIKNLYSATIGIMLGGALEYGVSPWPAITFPYNYDNVAAGATVSFAGNFIMPNKAVNIHAYSYWYGADGLWHFDDEEAKDINLGAVTPEFSNFAVSSLEKV